jgi:hypothetical protein
MSKPFKSNLKSFNEKSFEEKTKKIKAALNLAEKSRVEFKSVHDLIRFVASASGISRTTIPRNPRYMQIINEYFANKCLSDIHEFSAQTPPDVLTAKISSDSLSISNLKAEVKRLTAYIENNKENLIEVTEKPAIKEVKTASDADFSDTCMALFELIKWLDGSISLDTKKGVLVDLSGMPGANVILQKKRLEPFLRWLKGVNNE